MKRLLALMVLTMAIQAADFRGAQFIGFSDLSKFTREANALTSPPIESALNWNELIVSWNLRGEGLAKIEVRVVFPDTSTPWYQMGFWSAAERHSVKDQADDFATVATDTIMMKRPGGKAQARITVSGGKVDDLKYFSFCFADTKTKPEPLPANKKAWGKVVDVGVRSQLDYPEGAKNWCSPTSYSMILDYWSHKLDRPELSMPVPEVAHRVFDPMWPGTGNWPFNTALGGNFPGLRSYVTRLTDVSELEDWIEAGIPVATSVSYNRLKGLGKPGSGHLIVCVGFDKDGDIIVNDPGTRKDNVRRTFSRALFREAWADSDNTVYIVHPEDAKIPTAKMSHWE